MRTVPCFLFLVSAIVGCGVPENRPSHRDTICREDPRPLPESRCDPSCDPRRGSLGRTVIEQRAIGEYQYRDVWCSVGRVLPKGCYFGVYVHSQSVGSTTCREIAKSCTDPDSTYDVSCNAEVDCIYDCDGECNPKAC